MNLELFLVAMIPLTLYGFITKAFRNSTNTMLLVLVVDMVGWYIRLELSLSCIPHTFFVITYLVLFALFIRAVFFKKKGDTDESIINL